MLESNLLDSSAYKDLSFSAAKILPHFLRKPKIPLNRSSAYEVAFSFSYKEARRYGFANSTFHRIVCELIERGFLDQVSAGICFEDLKLYNKFRLSRRWEDYGKPGFIKKKWIKHDLHRIEPRSKNENVSLQ